MSGRRNRRHARKINGWRRGKTEQTYQAAAAKHGVARLAALSGMFRGRCKMRRRNS